MKTRLLLILILATAFLLSGVTQLSAQSAAVVKSKILGEPPVTVDRTLMLQLVNEVRKKGCQCGETYYYPAPPLTWNTKLEAAAYHHSVDMKKNKYFSHYAPDGSRGGNRIERAGYVWKTYGENIGEGYKTEKEMLAGWLSSPGHCKNIMNKAYKEMGVARTGTLWTQTFGTR